jgi:aspartyl-tRNA(Asn)/glutamyl-tRNA(Gln) amidotransferase subunit B
MEEGSLRCDANVSVRPTGAHAFGVKAEIKNLNSFRHVQRALEYEIERQTAALSEGGRVVQETRLWDAGAGRTVSMRSKEEAHDYRYFPEPDLPPLQLDPAWIDAVRASLPELPDARRRRLVREYAIPDYDAGVLTQEADVAAYFETTAAAAGNAKAASNWIMGELMRKANEAGVGVTALPITPAALAGLIRLVDAGTITSPVAKAVFEKMLTTGRTAEAIVADEGLASMDDEAAIMAAIRQVVDANADAVAQYRAGKQQTFSFLVGQVMKATRGKASPGRVNALMRSLLDGPT